MGVQLFPAARDLRTVSENNIQALYPNDVNIMQSPFSKSMSMNISANKALGRRSWATTSTNSDGMLSSYEDLCRMAEALRQVLDIKDRSWRLRKYKKCFVGREAVEMMCWTGMAQTVDQAVELGTTMLQCGIFHHVCYEHPFRNKFLFYRFSVDDVHKEGVTPPHGKSDMVPASPLSVLSVGTPHEEANPINSCTRRRSIADILLLNQGTPKHRSVVAKQVENLYQKMAALSDEVVHQKLVIKNLQREGSEGRPSMDVARGMSGGPDQELGRTSNLGAIMESHALELEDSDMQHSAATAAAVAAPPMSIAKHFSGNPLDRSSHTRRLFGGKGNSHDEVSLVVVAGREVCVKTLHDPQHSGVLQQDLQAILLDMDDPDLDFDSEQICLNWTSGRKSQQCYSFPLYLLGRDPTSQRWTFALDVTEAKRTFHSFLQEQVQQEVAFKDLRMLLPSLQPAACAIAGQAVALAQWHQTHHFCPACGANSVPVQSGSRRQCTLVPAHQLHPQMDPVIMTLVESIDGEKLLLGRSKTCAPGMYTCISGHMDPCEPIEEAVKRRTLETARVGVESVRFLGSQPWPVGRYGSCELIIGCLAKATLDQAIPDLHEMEDVQWYEREELLAAIGMYERAPESAQESRIQKASWGQLGFFVPPPYSIAHHLIKSWATKQSGAWFGAPLSAAAAAAASAPAQQQRSLSAPLHSVNSVDDSPTSSMSTSTGRNSPGAGSSRGMRPASPLLRSTQHIAPTDSQLVRLSKLDVVESHDVPSETSPPGGRSKSRPRGSTAAAAGGATVAMLSRRWSDRTDGSMGAATAMSRSSSSGSSAGRQPSGDLNAFAGRDISFAMHQ